MESVILKAEPRKMTGHQVKNLRAKKMTPCVIYGRGVKTESLSVSSGELATAVQTAGSSTIIELDVAGNKKNVVIHDLQRNPVSGEILHCDFYQVKEGQKIKAEVNLRYKGVSAAVKDFGGILVKSVDKIEIEALPKDLPHEILVDIALLTKIDDSITLDQLEIPAGVKVLGFEKDQVIASIAPPRTEEELKKLDEEVTEDVEGVEGVKKEEGEDEATEGEESKEPQTKEEGEKPGAEGGKDQDAKPAKEEPAAKGDKK